MSISHDISYIIVLCMPKMKNAQFFDFLVWTLFGWFFFSIKGIMIMGILFNINHFFSSFLDISFASSLRFQETFQSILIKWERIKLSKMVGKEKSNFNTVHKENLVVDTNSASLTKQEHLLLSPTSSHSSDYSDHASTSASLCYEQKAITKYDENSETTSSNDKLDRWVLLRIF
jgi:hypothetical protein